MGGYSFNPLRPSVRNCATVRAALESRGSTTDPQPANRRGLMATNRESSSPGVDGDEPRKFVISLAHGDKGSRVDASLVELHQPGAGVIFQRDPFQFGQPLLVGLSPHAGRLDGFPPVGRHPLPPPAQHRGGNQMQMAVDNRHALHDTAAPTEPSSNRVMLAPKLTMSMLDRSRGPGLSAWKKKGTLMEIQG